MGLPYIPLHWSCWLFTLLARVHKRSSLRHYVDMGHKKTNGEVASFS